MLNAEEQNFIFSYYYFCRTTVVSKKQETKKPVGEKFLFPDGFFPYIRKMF